MTIKEANQKLLFSLYHDYDNREAANIADWMMEALTGWKKIDRVINSAVKMSRVQEKELDRYVNEINLQRPVQYILHESWFCGLKLFVNENVLIPRPETEELVEWISKEHDIEDVKLFDIGTGSGCIPVALKHKHPSWIIHACDISKASLEVAGKNASLYNSNIHFFEGDVLNEAQWARFPEVNVIVSNPPYIPLQQKSSMSPNVILHEPAIALFVDNYDPLIFYRSIIALADLKLLKGGSIYVEIHEDLATETAELFTQAGYKNVDVQKDMQGKNRMIRAY